MAARALKTHVADVDTLRVSIEVLGPWDAFVLGNAVVQSKNYSISKTGECSVKATHTGLESVGQHPATCRYRLTPNGGPTAWRYQRHH